MVYIRINNLKSDILPAKAEKDDKPLFTDSVSSAFELLKAEVINGNTVLNYKK